MSIGKAVLVLAIVAVVVLAGFYVSRTVDNVKAKVVAHQAMVRQ